MGKKAPGDGLFASCWTAKDPPNAIATPAKARAVSDWTSSVPSAAANTTEPPVSPGTHPNTSAIIAAAVDELNLMQGFLSGGRAQLVAKVEQHKLERDNVIEKTNILKSRA